MLLDEPLKLTKADLSILKTACNYYQEAIIRIHDSNAKLYQEVPAFRKYISDKGYIKNLSDMFYQLQCYWENPESFVSASKAEVDDLIMYLNIWSDNISQDHGPGDVSALLVKLNAHSSTLYINSLFPLN